MPVAYRARRLSRRSIVLVVAAALALALAAQAGSTVDARRAATASTIKIGVVLPYTGPFGLYGAPMEAAFRARFAQVKNKVAGHPIQLVFEDEATDVNTAVVKVTKLITEDHVNAVVCCVTGGATLAVGPILAARKIPQLGPIPNPTGLDKYKTAVLVAPTAGHDAEMLGKYAAAKLKYRHAVVLASDFSYGHEVAEGFTKGFTGAGGDVSKQVFAPLGTQDFGSYLTQVGSPDVVFGGFAGADAIGFVKQYRRFGLKPTLIGHGPLVTELVLKAIGPSAVGIGAGFYYSSRLPFAANKAFVTTMTEAVPGFVPSHFTAGSWTTAAVLIDSIQRLRGNVSNGATFAATIRKTRIQAPWGPLRFDLKTGYVIAPTYFYTVVDNGGQLQHQILATIK